MSLILLLVLTFQNPLPLAPSNAKVTITPISGFYNPIVYWDDSSWVRGKTYSAKFFKPDGTLALTVNNIDYSLLTPPTYQWFSMNAGWSLPEGEYEVSICDSIKCSSNSALFYYSFLFCCWR